MNKPICDRCKKRVDMKRSYHYEPGYNLYYHPKCMKWIYVSSTVQVYKKMKGYDEPQYAHEERYSIIREIVKIK